MGVVPGPGRARVQTRPAAEPDALVLCFWRSGLCHAGLVDLQGDPHRAGAEPGVSLNEGVLILEHLTPNNTVERLSTPSPV